MRLGIKAAAAVAGFLLAGPATALAQNAVTMDETPLRAGPGAEFPRITIVPEDADVRVHGCIAGYDWCDVSWRYERGWLRGRDLSYVWNGRYVIIEDWGPRIGLPVIGFSVRDYWTRYYSNRPFFEQRNMWFERDRGRWERRDEFRQREDFGGRDERRFDQREERRQDHLDGRGGRTDQEGAPTRPPEQRQGGAARPQQRGPEQRPDEDEARGQRREQREQQPPGERRERGGAQGGERGERM